METPVLVGFLLCCLCPTSVFCVDSSEEYRDEERVRPNYGIEIKWIDQGQTAGSKIYKSFSEPAGLEDTFLCRAYHGKTWVPGKLFGRSCYITKNRLEHRFEEFQVPSAIPGNKITKWITLNKNAETRQLPRNVVVGGNFWDTTAYICRGLFGRVVIPGSYHPTENVCYLENNGEQVAWKGDTEVLVLDEKENTPPKS